jgi:uncharacterized protein (UPF0548 family)
VTFTYAEVGATRGELPRGYRIVEWSALLGVDWETARAEVMRWGLKTRSGFRVSPAGPVVAGAAVVIRVGPFREPVRVVYTIDEPDRRGFAYGTLPGHPVEGEESFVVARRAGGVWLDIRSFSRPSRRWRVLAPLLRRAQDVALGRYLRALS